MTLMPEVPRLRLHAYVGVCSTELQLQPSPKLFQQFQVRLVWAGYGTDNGPHTV